MAEYLLEKHLTPIKRKIRRYLQENEFNTISEIASDLGYEELDIVLAIDSWERGEDEIREGFRPDAYGNYVYWLSRR